MAKLTSRSLSVPRRALSISFVLQVKDNGSPKASVHPPGGGHRRQTPGWTANANPGPEAWHEQLYHQRLHPDRNKWDTTPNPAKADASRWLSDPLPLPPQASLCVFLTGCHCLEKEGTEGRHTDRVDVYFKEVGLFWERLFKVGIECVFSSTQFWCLRSPN